MRIMRVIVLICFLLPILTEYLSLEAIPRNFIEPVRILLIAQILLGLGLCIPRVEKKIGTPLLVFLVLLVLAPLVWFWRFIPLLVSFIGGFVFLGGALIVILIGTIAVLAVIAFLAWIHQQYPFW